MKTGLLFTLTAGGLSLVFLWISAQFMNALTAEITYHLFWFYMVWTIIGIMVFPFAVVLIRSMTAGSFWKVLIYLGLGLIILNFPFGAQDNEWITIDMIRDLIHPGQVTVPGFAHSFGVLHLPPFLAFSLSLFLFRNRLFYPLPQPPAAPE